MSNNHEGNSRPGVGEATEVRSWPMHALLAYLLILPRGVGSLDAIVHEEILSRLRATAQPTEIRDKYYDCRL